MMVYCIMQNNMNYETTQMSEKHLVLIKQTQVMILGETHIISLKEHINKSIAS